MHKNALWTKLGSRLQLVKSAKGAQFNWLFLPGGPGLGSESLHELIDCLDIPGSLWCLDLPGDGSNTTSNNAEAFQHWSSALLEAVNAFENVILVGHSTGGMYALATPLLEKALTGLVLIDSAPDTSWQIALGEMMKASPIPALNDLNQLYIQNPSPVILKEMTLTSASYFFTEQGLQKGLSMLSGLPYNVETCNWSDKNFDSTYQAKWIPQTLPTLIMAGSHDYMTSLNLFKNNEAFHRPNIMMHEISQANHFPWIENPKEVAALFNDYCKLIQ